MIGALLKHWKLILDILIIVVVVFLIFLWNPFNLFGKGLKLQDTANMVSEIKEIGELVTAEYYGEVISSDEEAELGLIEKDTIEILGERMYYEIKREILYQYEIGLDLLEKEIQSYNRERKRKNRREKGIGRLRGDIIEELIRNIDSVLSIKNEDLFNALVLYIGTHEFNLDPNAKKFIKKNSKGKDKYIEKTLGKILQAEYDEALRYYEGDIAYQNYLTQGFQSSYPFQDFYLEYMHLKKVGEVGKKEANKQLALIGRGSVKAGFKFNELNEGNFVYDENRKVIHFFGFHAEILNQDINPWFIPEKRVPGFQIIAEKNSDFYQLKQVKEHCIEKLVNNARKAGIVADAQKNGEEALKVFFSLLTGEEIKSVFFHQDPLIYESKEILKDSLIDFNELSLIDSLVARNIRSIGEEDDKVLKQRREQLLNRFIADLSKVEIKVSINKRSYQYPFNYYNRFLPGLLIDSVVTKKEIDWIGSNIRHKLVAEEGSTYQEPPISYNFWFKDSLEYLSSFNVFIDSLLCTKAKRGFLDEIVDETLDIVIPSGNKELWEQKAIERDKLIEKSNGKLSYQYVGDTIRFYNLVSVEKPDYLKYLIKKKIDFNEFISVDSTHNILSKETDIDLKGYSLIYETDKSNSFKLDTILFEFENKDSVKVDSTLFIKHLGRFEKISFLGSPIINERPNGKRDTIIDTTFYPAEFSFLSLTPSEDSFLIKKIKVANEDQYEISKLIDESSGNTKKDFKWNDNDFILGASVLKEFPNLQIGKITPLRVFRKTEAGYILSRTGNVNDFSNSEFEIQKLNSTFYTWRIRTYAIDSVDANSDSLQKALNCNVSSDIIQKIENGVEVNVYLHTPNNNWYSIRNREIVALREYLLNANRKYNDVSAVIKARRNFDQFIKENTKFSGLDSARNSMTTWIDKNIIKNIKQ